MQCTPDKLPSDPMVRALLSEILSRLGELDQSGEVGRIDLRRLPLPPDGLTTIATWLGNGEIEATLKGVGTCEFRETATAGVWWIVQRNTSGDTVGEFIEIAFVPELLKCAREDVASSVAALRERLDVRNPTR